MENAGSERGMAGGSNVYKEAIGGFYRTILACAIGTIFLLSLAFWGWKGIPNGVVGQQEWVAYLGIIFATAVAFAGSLVAIMLASRALDSAKAQSELAEHANKIADAQSKLSDQANKIAERQSTESMMAVDGSARYQQFKSILFTMPIMLRRAQRDRLFDDHGNIALLGQIVQTMGTALDAFLSSSVPATAAALADTIDLGPFPSAAAQKMPSVPEQRYVEQAVSSLYYDLSVIRITLALPPAQRSHLTLRLQLMRLLDATYALVHELDRVFNRAAELRATGEYGFSLLQERFIEHVAPVSRLNHDLNLSEDFNEFARQILGENQSIIPGAIPFREAPAESVGSGGMLVSLQDSGLAQALAGIRGRLEKLGLASQLVRLDDGAWIDKATRLATGVVPIFLITEQFANRFLQLHHFLASDRASAWPQRVAAGPGRASGRHQPLHPLSVVQRTTGVLALFRRSRRHLEVWTANGFAGGSSDA
ncbi:hypothetical protein [Massilia sp. HP4]|uniref:hypothetical protein n=1 Tax=Massilia sp. HP4 TaxID=2562316 RepID=UPI00148551F5|nr:hypothetical protein [Massilia sp. HP4]